MDAGQGQGSVSGGVLDALQRLVDLQRLRYMLCTLCAESIILDAVNTGELQASVAADSRGKRVRQRTQVR